MTILVAKLLVFGFVIPVIMANLGLFLIEKYVRNDRYSFLVAMAFAMACTAALVGGMFLATSDEMRVKDAYRPVTVKAEKED